MPQLCLYLDDETMEGLRVSAQRKKTSLSRYVADLIRNQDQSASYPEGFFALYGCLADDGLIVVPDDPAPEPIEPLFS
ncbi:MAG: antitoxin [Coriobacteriia bacterium]|nr:antitoxin [Coriobacteriia bacterium]